MCGIATAVRTLQSYTHTTCQGVSYASLCWMNDKLVELVIIDIIYL